MTINVLYLILNTLPISNKTFDLIFFPPGNKPYSIAVINSVLFCFLINFFKNKLVSFAILTSLFKIDYNTLITIGAAVECIHAYSLIHDDLPCMDNDKLRRGKPSTHIKFGESTAVLAGNSLLTMAFEILTSSNLKINEKTKVDLVQKLSETSGHLGIAGGQYLDLSFEKKKISKNKIINMEIKKTGKLFSFCCAVPTIIKKKNNKDIKFFENIGANIGLLFQIADDLIDFKGSSRIAGKITGKDEKKGKATLISLLGYQNAIKYADKIKFKIIKDLNKYSLNSTNLNDTLDYILTRNR